MNLFETSVIIAQIGDEKIIPAANGREAQQSFKLYCYVPPIINEQTGYESVPANFPKFDVYGNLIAQKVRGIPIGAKVKVSFRIDSRRLESKRTAGSFDIFANLKLVSIEQMPGEVPNPAFPERFMNSITGIPHAEAALPWEQPPVSTNQIASNNEHF